MCIYAEVAGPARHTCRQGRNTPNACRCLCFEVGRWTWIKQGLAVVCGGGEYSVEACGGGGGGGGGRISI